MPTTTRRVPQAYVRFRHCVVLRWGPDYLETVFPDGQKCPALFAYDENTRMRAAEAGYTHLSDRDQCVRDMHLDHELLHTIVGQMMGERWSPTLAHMAGVQPTSDDRRAWEEGVVVAMQRYLMRQHYDDGLLHNFDVSRALGELHVARLQLSLEPLPAPVPGVDA
jgi:hypothetical protein